MPTLWDYAASYCAERARQLQVKAASGTAGCVEARKRLQALRHDELRCTAAGWRGSMSR